VRNLERNVAAKQKGMMEEFFARAWENMSGRVGGPMSFRLVLQPMIATILAVRAGLQDARAGRPPYAWSVFTDPVHRADLLRDGWKGVAKVFVMAIVIDIVYQWIVFRWIHPVGLLTVAFLLACVPYLLIRGPVNRLVRSRRAQRRLT
jgi:hypothetical protein